MNEEELENIIIIKSGKDIFGNTVILYTTRDQPDLRRITTKSEDNI